MRSKYIMRITRLENRDLKYCWEGCLRYIDKKLQVPRETNFHANKAFLEFIKRVNGNYYYIYTYNKWAQQYIEPLREKPYYEHKNKPCTKLKNMV
jgi:hypothetical protein